jgi:hypothetical protein
MFVVAGSIPIALICVWVRPLGQEDLVINAAVTSWQAYFHEVNSSESASTKLASTYNIGLAFKNHSLQLKIVDSREVIPKIRLRPVLL